jgi:hypothetical protein
VKGYEYIKRTREYLDYLEEHLSNVQKAWEILKSKCEDMRFILDDYVYQTLDNEIYNHDLSKFSEFEFVQYREAFFQGATAFTPLSLDRAWEHHKENNPHHWENWTKQEYVSPYEWEINCVHMIIDWMAMGFKFNDTAQIYYEKNKDKIILPDYAITFIYEIFNKIY